MSEERPVATSPSGAASQERPLLDAHGCLTPAGLAVVVRAPVGGVPPELAQHVAGCSRCQQAVLAGSVFALPRERRSAPPLWRTIMVLGVMLLAVLSLFVLLQWISPSR